MRLNTVKRGYCIVAFCTCPLLLLLVCFSYWFMLKFFICLSSSTSSQPPPLSSSIYLNLSIFCWYSYIYIYIYTFMGACVSCFSHAWLFVTLWTVARQAPLSIGFSRQEYCSGLPRPPPKDLSNLRIKPTSAWISCIAGGLFIHWVT